MAEGAFSLPSVGGLPQLEVEDMIDHIYHMDPVTYQLLFLELEEEERCDKPLLLKWLFARNRRLFDALERICAAFQSAFHVANQHRSDIMESYMQWRRLFRLYSQQLGPETHQVTDVGQKNAKKPKEKKEKKEEKKKIETARKRERELDEEKEDMTSARDPQEQQQWYYKEEPLVVEAFPFLDFVHFVKKGRNKVDLANLNNYGCWSKIYHCSGVWHAELLAEELQKQDKLAFVIKRKRGGADQEVLAYKVIAGEINK